MRFAALPIVAAHVAVATDIPTMPNIGYLALGYNIYYGNPRATGAGVDPGFHTHSGAPVYETKYSGKTTGDQKYQLPDGFNAVNDVGCALEFQSSATSKMTDYTDTLHVNAKVSGGAFGASFSASTDYKSFHEHTTNTLQREVSSTAECVVYDATVNLYAKPGLSDEMTAAIAQLTSEYGDGSMFFDIFDHFGTHSVESAKMGSRFGFSSYFSEQAWTNVERTSVDVKTAAKYEGLVASGSASAEVAKSHSAREAFDGNMTGYKEISLGAKPVAKGDALAWATQVTKEPMPISYSLRSICEAISNATHKANCVKAQSSTEYCTKRLLNERKDVSQCRDATDIDCSWDSDCSAGYACVNQKCLTGSFSLAWRPDPKLCLEVAGTQLRVNTCNGGTAQKWQFNGGEYQSYMQIQYASDNSKCIDGTSMANGGKLVISGCNGALSQTWARDPFTGAVYLPNGKGGNICMDAGSGIKAGKDMLVWQCNVLPQQQFDIVQPKASNNEVLV